MKNNNNRTKLEKNRPRIDWSDIKRRMDIARAAIEHAASPDPEEVQRILKQRAQALGQQPPSTDAAGEHIEVLEFVLAQEHYAVESCHVRDVYPLEQLTPIPCTPPFVLGIVNLRGEILSIVDIKKFFDLPEKGLTDLNKVIVLDANAMRFGILADSIVGVHRLAEVDIQPPPPTFTGIHADYLRGVTPRRLVVLDAGQLLADSRIIIQEQVVR